MPAAIAQLGERQTEDLKVPGSIPGLGIFFLFLILPFFSSRFTFFLTLSRDLRDVGAKKIDVYSLNKVFCFFFTTTSCIHITQCLLNSFIMAK